MIIIIATISNNNNNSNNDDHEDGKIRKYYAYAINYYCANGIKSSICIVHPNWDAWMCLKADDLCWQPRTKVTETYHGVHWGKYSTKRTDFSGKGGPGPGEYDPQIDIRAQAENLNLRDGEKGKFDAKLPRYHEWVVKEEEKKVSFYLLLFIIVTIFIILFFQLVCRSWPI